MKKFGKTRPFVLTLLALTLIVLVMDLKREEFKTAFAREVVKTEITTETEEYLVNMEEVVDFSATETGLQLTFSDGSGYYYERETPKETVYVIVDIIIYAYNADFNGTTELYCEMPNGDIEVFAITDAPEPQPKCKIACLSTTDLEDYSTYKVVAVR